jgi:serine/threonine protein phosphatase PrpC
VKPIPEPAEEHDEPERPRSTPGAQAHHEVSTSSMFEVNIAARSYPGNERPNNDNHFLVLRVERSLETVSNNLPESVLPRRFDETAHGMLVASGMGGMPAGEVASSMAVRKLVELVVNTPDWIMRMSRRKASVVKQRMTDRFHKIDEALKQHVEEDSRLLGMSATLTVACSLGADLFIGHIGDSRAYLLRGDELIQLTRDDTLAQSMIDAGIYEAENAIVRGMRRVLTAALGASGLPVNPQVEHLQLCDGDQLLLCTGVLTDVVDAEAIVSILRTASSAEEACRELIKTMLGGDDNVTIVLARYRFPQAA